MNICPTQVWNTTSIDLVYRVASLVSGLLIAVAQVHAREQAYPSRPIRLVSTSAPGGSSDVIARTVAQQVESASGWNFVVDNRAGAAGIIGYGIVAKAAPDGYTVLHATAALVINPSIYRKLPYDVGDFAPITSLGSAYGYLVIVNPSVRARELRDLIALARNKDRRLLYGSPGVGNTLHLAGATFNERAGTHLVHVPYKGVAPVFNALISGEIQVLFSPPAAILQHVQSGKVRALAFTGPRRWEGLPDVPTVAEVAIPGFDISGSWHGWFAPAKTPGALIDQLYQALRVAIHTPKVRDFLKVSGYEPDGRPPAEFRRFIAAEVRRYAEEVRKAGVEPQ